MLWAPVPDRSKPLLISTGYWIPCLHKASKLLMVLYTHWALRIQCWILNVTSIVMGCSHHTTSGGTAQGLLSSSISTETPVLHRERWAGKASSWRWKNPLDDFGPHKKCSILLKKSFWSAQRQKEGAGESKTVQDWGQSTQVGWYALQLQIQWWWLPLPALTVYSWRMNEVSDKHFLKHWFSFLHISFCLPSHRLESSDLYSLFLN